MLPHRASRNFRNYWHYYPSGFDEFREKIKVTWPGMDVTPPEVSDDGKIIAMFCVEDRIGRELFWTGFGFQAWCQLLTHISREESATILVIDEPDFYLHPDLQRQLVTLLRDVGPDILIATHSTDIIAESDPIEILVVDKHLHSARRVRSPEGIGNVLEYIGSSLNFAMTQIARKRRVLFLEGEEFNLLKKFAKCVGCQSLSAGTGVAVFPLGGFPPPGVVRSVSLGIRRSLGERLIFGGVFDRDFRPLEEVNETRDELKKDLAFVAILARKETENYLLVPAALDRALSRELSERSRRTGEPSPTAAPMEEILDKITEQLKFSLQGQYVSKRTNYFGASHKDGSTITKEALEEFESKWKEIETRMEIVPGKKVLSQLREFVQKEYKVNLTDSRIINAFATSDVPSDLLYMLRDLERFCSSSLEPDIGRERRS